MHAGYPALRVLAAIAAQGSVTKAAKQLNYSQPAVSHHLARLEAETGARLVQRVGRGIRLTPEGEHLARRATEIVGRVDTAAAELSAMVGLRTGRVRSPASSRRSPRWCRTPRAPCAASTPASNCT